MRRFELKSLTEYTDEAVLEEIRRVAQIHSGGPFTLAAFERLSPRVSSGTIQHRFGSWGAALRKAGLENLSRERFQSAYEEQLSRGRNMSDEELIEEIRRVYRLAGRDVLTVRDFNRVSVTRYDMVRGRFSGWHEALDRAGIAKSDAGKRYTEEQCFENIAALWTHYGRQPKYAELKKPPSTVSDRRHTSERDGEAGGRH